MRVDRRLAFVSWLALVAGCGPTPPTIVERRALQGHSREVVSIAVAPDGQSLASRGADGIKVWDLATGAEAVSLPPDGSDFGSVAFSPDSKTLASDRVGLGSAAWEIPGGREKATYLFPKSKPTSLTGLMSPGWGLAYSPDGRTLAGGGSRGGEDGFLCLWDTASGDGAELAALRRPITTVAYSPDGRTIASGGMDGKLVLWDPATRRERLRIEANRSYLAPVAFSPDGRMVASANEARWVKLWDSGTGSEVGVLQGHIKAVLSLAFSPDGKMLVSGDSGGTIFVWDPVARRMIARLESDRGKVWGLTFTPDGRTLISAGEDRLVHLWDVARPSP
jgi:WD40 repeat protein